MLSRMRPLQKWTQAAIFILAAVSITTATTSTRQLNLVDLVGQSQLILHGTVKSVTGTALTIASGGKDMTFTVDGSTKFVGKGLGTKARTGKLTAPDAVGTDDAVSVTYHDMGGTLHAASVRITNKAMKK